MKNLKGELLIVGSAVCGSLLPVISNPKNTSLPPLWLAACGSMIALAIFTALFFVRSRHSELMNKPALALATISAVLIGIIYTGLVFVGSYNTSPQNASIIVTFDVLVAMLLFRKVDSEKLSIKEVIGGLLLVSSGVILFFPDSTKVNSGDLILLLASFITPVGNKYMKKARSMISAETILLIRGVITSISFCTLAWVFNGLPETNIFTETRTSIILNGALVLGLSKIFWIEGINLIPIAKASSIISMSPIMTFILAALFLRDLPEWNQLIAIPACLTGLMLIIKPRKSLNLLVN